MDLNHRPLACELEEKKELRALLKEEFDWARHYSYADLAKEADFERLSKPSATKRESDDLNFWKIGQKRGDDKYDFINDIDGYRKTANILNATTGQLEKIRRLHEVYFHQ